MKKQAMRKVGGRGAGEFPFPVIRGSAVQQPDADANPLHSLGGQAQSDQVD